MSVLNYYNFDTLGSTEGTEGPNQFRGIQTAAGYEATHIRLDPTSPVIGSNCLRVEIVDGLYRDNYPLCRSECYTRVHGGSEGTAKEGWYSFSFRAETLTTGEESAVISQLHKGSGGSNTPCLSFQWRFSDNQVFLRRYNPSGSNDNFNLFIASNEWNHVRMWYRSRLDGTGRIKIWVNGVLVVNHTGVTDIPGGEYDHEKPYWKLGLYAASFGEGNLPNRVAYFDAVSYHDDTSSEADTLAWIDNFVNPTPDPTGKWYVSNNGLDSNNGYSGQTPFKTFNKALSMVSLGETILLECGGKYDVINITSKHGQSNNKYYVSNYGTGDNPVISGFVSPIWVNEGNNIWSCHDSGFDKVNLLKIGASTKPKGRLPKNGYRAITARSGTTQISDSVNLPSSPNLIGGELVSKKNKWILDTQTVTAQTSNSLTTTSASSYSYTVGYGYFIQNHINCLTQQGDWCFNSAEKKVYVYSTVNPNTLGIQVAKKQYSLYLNQASNWEFFGIEFEGSYDIAALVRYSNYAKFIRCEFSDHGNNGVQTFVSTHVTVDDCNINNINNTGVNNRDASPNFTIINSRINNVAMIAGASGSGDGQACGIKINNTEHNAVIRNNQLHNMGYIGIYYAGNNCLVEKNYAKNGCAVKSDGALFYTYGSYTGIICRDNIGEDCNGNLEGTSGTVSDSAIFYFDDNSRNVTFQRNYATRAAYGFYLHNTQNMVGSGNVACNNRIQCRFADDSLGDAISNLNLQNNSWVALSGQMVYEIRTENSNLNYGIINNNKIKSLDNNSYRTRLVVPNSLFEESLSGWRTRTGNDTQSEVIEYNEDDALILVNEGEGNEFIFEGVYEDLLGNEYDSSIELPENGSIYLYKTGDAPDPVPTPHNITIHSYIGGSAVVVTLEPYTEGKTIQVQASHAANHKFKHWILELFPGSTGIVGVNQSTFSFTMPGNDVAITPVFEVIKHNITTASTAGGIATGAGEYNQGETATLEAIEDDHYQFVRWTEGGQQISTSNPLSFIVESARTLTPVFSKIKYALTVTSSPGGTASGGGSFDWEIQTPLVATVNNGFEFSGWYRANQLLSKTNPYDYTTRKQDDAIEARFTLIPAPDPDPVPVVDYIRVKGRFKVVEPV